MINKPQKLDYTIPKAYCPIALLECTGKLLEKIVAKCINADIEQYDLLPMTQFGSQPKHNAIDAVANLIHKIQSTVATSHVGALLLFDILGFFDNVNPLRATKILRNKGFPPPVCAWALSFLTRRKAAIRIGNYISEPFPVLNGTPQGSPLSPILSALYTSPLLDIAKTWQHADLSLYVDNSAIYTISATLKAATESARTKYEAVLTWLHANGLQTDAAKTKLMTFTRTRANPKFVGPPIHGARYTLPTGAAYHVSTIKSLRYLGVWLNHRLDWTHHITIMANRARLTIRGVSLLGNSIRGLDFLNWRKVYNALIIPTLTYRAQVWYTSKRQKGLVHRL